MFYVLCIHICPLRVGGVHIITYYTCTDACMDVFLNACNMNHVLQYVRAFPSGWVHNTQSEGGGSNHDLLREPEGNVTRDLHQVLSRRVQGWQPQAIELLYLSSHPGNSWPIHTKWCHVVTGMSRSTPSIVHRPSFIVHRQILRFGVWNFTTYNHVRNFHHSSHIPCPTGSMSMSMSMLKLAGPQCRCRRGKGSQWVAMATVDYSKFSVVATLESGSFLLPRKLGCLRRSFMEKVALQLSWRLARARCSMDLDFGWT